MSSVPLVEFGPDHGQVHRPLDDLVVMTSKWTDGLMEGSAQDVTEDQKSQPLAFSLVTWRQSVCQCLFSRCPLILTVVLNLWLHSVSTQAAHPVA